MSSQVEIIVDGVDVTTRVVYSSAVFEEQQNAIPGTFEITLKDPERTYEEPPTGCEIVMSLDGVRHFGGYVTQITRKFALPVDEVPSDARLWVLRGADYNILFDKRVTRRDNFPPESYKRHLPVFHGDDYDGDLLSYFSNNYIDKPAGLDASTYVDNVTTPFYSEDPETLAGREGGWKQQGTPWREQIELLQQWSGAVFYISPDFDLHYHAIETAEAPFGFSDQPDGVNYIGMRDVTATERGGPEMTNDAFVWGGSEWSEDVVFARSENTDSIDDHGLWQRAEWHFGEDSYKLTTQWRADLIVEGSETVIEAGFNPGEAFPQYDLSLTWFAENQPAGQQIRAGQLVTTFLTTFGDPFNPIVLPMRSIRITFPGVDPNGLGHVQLSGSMGLSLTDPFTIWGQLRKQSRSITPMLAVALDDTDVPSYGAFGQVTPVLVSGLIYSTPGGKPYIPGTTQLFKDGLLQRRDVDYFETAPLSGRFTFASDPGAAVLWLVFRSG